MNWLLDRLHVLHPTIVRSSVLSTIIVIGAAVCFLGLAFWYGPMMAGAIISVWGWQFIPDYPLFGLFGGLALLMLTVLRRHWRPDIFGSAPLSRSQHRSTQVADPCGTLSRR